MSTTISSTVEIDATPDAVWEALTDFASYPEWNPFMDRIDGTAQVGSKLAVHMRPPGGRAMTFKPTVLAVVPGHELRWLGKLGVGGLFDGEHSFVLTPNAGGGTRLTQSEDFTGVLVGLFKGTLKHTDAGFDALNQALKQRVETASSR